MNKLPLDGIRIVELTAIYAGPYASMILADWGAEIIRVETIQGMIGSTRGQYARAVSYTHLTLPTNREV